MKDWQAWHEPYKDPHSDLSRRLVIVQGFLRQALREHTSSTPASLISLCAGDGRDVLGVLEPGDQPVVRGLLMEYDSRLVNTGRAAIRAAGLSDQLELRQGDAADMQHYQRHVPADVVLACGVFGNISDRDVKNTIEHLPQLVRPDGTVIWTRSRRTPDLTPKIREQLADLGFAEQAFAAPNDVQFTVGVTRYEGESQTFDATAHLFTFV